MNESHIFTEALKLSTPSERSAYLDEACAGHPQLRTDVEALLRAKQDDPDFLEQPAQAFEKTAVHGQSPAGQSAADGSLNEGKGSVLGGRYKLYEQIGEGGMGTVWMALQSVPVRRQVAVKLIKAGMDSRDVISRFQAERQALALMDHPNIAKVLDAGTTTGGRPYFVMELVKGIPLTKYCDEKRLSLRERLELFIPVCQAIQHAHQKGIIHRDIKPSNVLVCLYDGRPVPKVIDFGVAKATGQQLTEQTLVTGFGSIIGTLEYMSPEQAELNQLDIDTRSDIYSLGVLLYELLTGTTPLERKRFQQAAMLELLRLIREVDPPRPSLRLSESKETLPSISAQRKSEPARLTILVRGELDWIVMKALDKDRNRRYETANGFLQDVQRYLADEPVHACPPSTAYRFRKFVRRNKAGLTAGSLVAMALVVGMLLSFWQAVRATKAEEVARVEQSKAKRLAINESEAHALAVDQTRLANERAEDLARRLYVHRVNLAYREAEANNVAQADALLVACEPTRRGWEWAFSRQLCHLETMTLGGFADHAEAVAAARRGPAAPPKTEDPAVDKVVWELMGASGNVRGVAMSPDGKWIAAARADGTIGIYETRTGREVRSLAGHDGCASCVTFDTEGNRVISGGLDRTIRVWNANTGEAIQVLRGHTLPILSIACRPGTDELASSSFGAWATFAGEGFEIKQWDMTSGREIRSLQHGHGWAYTSVAYSADGKRLVSNAVWGGLLRIWDADTGEQLEERRIPEYSQALALSPADGRIAFSGLNNMLYVSSKEFGTEMRGYRGHTAPIIGIAFSRDGSWVASACEDSTILIWNVATGRALKPLRGHTASVNSIAFHPDNSTLVSSSADGTIKLWDIPTQPGGLPLNNSDWANQVRFSPDGRQTAVVRFLAAYVMDSTSRRILYEVPPPGLLAFSRDGRFLATCSKDSDTVNLLNAKTGKSIGTSLKSAGPLRSLCFGIGNRLAFSADDGEVHFWDVDTGQAESVLRAGEAGALGMTFDPAGTALATIGQDCAVRLWDPATGQLVRQLCTASGRLAPYVSDGLAFDPEGRRLAAVGGDATVAVWEIETGAEVLRLRGHTRAINAVAFSPDGRRIATASEDFTIKLWDATNGDEVLTLRGHTGFVLGLAFSPDGNRLSSASADGTVRAWDAKPEYADFDQRMSAVLSGEPVKDTQELLAFGQRSYDLHRFALATRWFGEALEHDVAIAEDRQAQHAYNAACVAALAGTGQGVDDPPLNDMTKAKLREQALAWLHAELERWTRVVQAAEPKQCQVVVQTLAHWQVDSDLSVVRGDAIGKLPESEQVAWRALWTAVDEVRLSAATKPSEP